jgi:hypothetical protein
MSFSPLFGIGECMAQAYAFKVLWLQHRRIHGINGDNSTFSGFYSYATALKVLRLTETGELTFTEEDSDGIYTPAGFLNLRRKGEDTYSWSKRMETEYPWDDYRHAVLKSDIPILDEEIGNRVRNGF